MKVKMKALNAIAQRNNGPSAIGTLANLRGISAVVVHQVHLLIKAIQPHLEAFNAAKDGLLEKYGKPVPNQPGQYSFMETTADGEGKPVTSLNVQAIQGFNKEVAELEALDCEIPGPLVVPLSAISDKEGGCLITAAEMETLSSVISFVEETKAA